MSEDIRDRELRRFVGTPQAVYVHLAEHCLKPCALHGPSDHPMASWPLRWRKSRRQILRVCEHGVVHPDPDQIGYLRVTVGEWAASNALAHACDGCCGLVLDLPEPYVVERRRCWLRDLAAALAQQWRWPK